MSAPFVPLNYGRRPPTQEENERVKIHQSVFLLTQIRAPAFLFLLSTYYTQTNDRLARNGTERKPIPPQRHRLPLGWPRRFSKLYLFNLNCRYHFKRDGRFQYRCGRCTIDGGEGMISAEFYGWSEMKRHRHFLGGG